MQSDLADTERIPAPSAPRMTCTSGGSTPEGPKAPEAKAGSPPKAGPLDQASAGSAGAGVLDKYTKKP